MSYETRIPRIIAGLKISAELTESEVADRVVEAAKDRVPRRTDALYNAIHKEPADGGFAVLAGDSEVFYGHIVEHGGVHTSPRPFLVPAAEMVRGEVQAIGRAKLSRL